MATVYLALYKGQAQNRFERLQDGLIRFFSKGKYSHCEIAIECYRFNYGDHSHPEIYYQCYSSSPRDNGVRCKCVDIHNGKWDLIPLNNLSEAQIKVYFEQTQEAKYDWWGVLGLALGIKQKRSKYFCSEWCFNVIFNSDEGWRFSPNQLAVMMKEARKK